MRPRRRGCGSLPLRTTGPRRAVTGSAGRAAVAVGACVTTGDRLRREGQRRSTGGRQIHCCSSSIGAGQMPMEFFVFTYNAMLASVRRRITIFAGGGMLRKRFRETLRRAAIQPGERVLDVGPGRRVACPLRAGVTPRRRDRRRSVTGRWCTRPATSWALPFRSRSPTPSGCPSRPRRSTWSCHERAPFWARPDVALRESRACCARRGASC